MTACVLGLGYVGLPLAVELAARGHEVVGVDTSAPRVAALHAGQSGIEDVDDAALAAVLASGCLTVTTDVAQASAADTYVICVPTPLEDSLPDLTAVEAAGRAVATVLSPGDLVVLESTTYPGTTEEVLAPLLGAGSGLTAGRDFRLAYSPERIDPGNPLYGLTNTPKIVGGVDDASSAAAREFYGQVVEQVVQVRGTREAELAKLLENTFRHVNIALVNEMAVFCRQLDVDLHEVIDAAATKPFGFMPFRPGPGVGGHCIPVDPSYLSWRVKKLGISFRFVELAQEINASMPAYVISRATEVLNDVGRAVRGSTVVCVGAAYKPGVSDCRESPAVEVLRQLHAKGARLRLVDPLVPEVAVSGAVVESEPLTEELLASADLVVLLTPHDTLDLDLLVRHAALVLDTRGALPLSERVHRL